ncbi:MAG: TIGR03032 family protein [Bacteroidales bacterium]|nr:TIGR03032 family protein [Bacteroidales bacterium]
MEKEEKRFKIKYDRSVAQVLTEIKSVIAISTYQASKVIFIGAENDTSLFQIPITFKKPMGIALSDNKMAVATLDEIQIFSDSKILAKKFPYNTEIFDSLYLPRATYYCGLTDLHDLSFGKGGLWAVNTRFSCISSFDINYSFIPRWKPSFITELAPQDRCHLNGMAMIDKTPAFVTALSKTNTAEGWRDNITKDGVLIKVPSGEIILDNLAMPHSPRIINDELYLLLSARGEVIRCDVKNKKYEVLTKISGFIRGMAFYKNYLFVGLSKVRKTSKTFSKLPVSEMANYAGIVVIDLLTNKIIGEITYQTTVEEIYDVQILTNTLKPGLISPDDERHKLAVTTKNISFWKKNK